ncbi:unnamed protein product [Paramecium sonneborni]|uniref:Uncharacterized protein n=1 Tax=Paramecium sonneborni TaxID=65129 RepID=A0A8S1M3Q9_9CILI|nr:unnamed protein product [Paramecium sonneborni]
MFGKIRAREQTEKEKNEEYQKGFKKSRRVLIQEEEEEQQKQKHLEILFEQEKQFLNSEDKQNNLMKLKKYSQKHFQQNLRDLLKYNQDQVTYI